MPLNSTTANHPNPKAQAKNPKGKPLGIPVWGWIAGAALGLIIGYILVKNRGSSSSTASDSGTTPSPLADQSPGSGGGVVASPPPANPNVITEQQASPVPTGDTSTQDSSGDNTNPFTPLALNPTPSNPNLTIAGGLDPAIATAYSSGYNVGFGGGSAPAQQTASGAAPSIIANPTPPTGNISPYSPNLPRHALNIAT